MEKSSKEGLHIPVSCYDFPTSILSDVVITNKRFGLVSIGQSGIE
jgi:hypothetical protein